MNRRPPLLARMILGRVVPARVRDEALGDLEEILRSSALSDRGARRAYWREALAWLIRAPIERARGGLGKRPPARLPRGAEPEAKMSGPAPPGSPTPRPFPRSEALSMQSILHDVRFALRALRAEPGFTLAAVVTLALAIGANTAIFSVVHGVALRPLPYPEPDELVMVLGSMTSRNVERFPSSFPELDEIRRQGDAFEEVAGIVSQPMGLFVEGSDPTQIQVGWVTDNLFRMLGVPPELGRDFTNADAVPGGPQVPLINQPISAPTVALLSDGFWRRALGADPAAVGSTMLLDGNVVEVVGVLPPGFTLLLSPDEAVASEHDVWVALRPDYATAPPLNVVLSVAARLRDDADLVSAQADLDTAARELRQRYDTLETAGFALRARPLVDDVTETSRPILMALMGAVGFVLLIACANVSNLLLVRATARQREMTIRAALGGTRGRLVRQLLTEYCLLASAAGLLGVALAAFGIDALLRLVPEDLPRQAEIGMHPVVLGFTLAASFVAALLVGALPAMQASRPAATEMLRRRETAPSGMAWMRRCVVPLEIALCVVLLVGAGLMVRSFRSLATLDPGFEADGVLSFTLHVPAARYPDPTERFALLRQLQERIEGIGAIESAAAAFPLPLVDTEFWGRYGTEDVVDDPASYRQANYRVVLPGYLEVMKTPLIDGRLLDEVDYETAARRVLVDERLAAQAWPGERAVGQRLWVRLTAPEPVEVEVVGVVGSQRLTSLSQPGRETIYYPASVIDVDLPMRWVARTSLAPDRLLPEIRAAAADIDPVLPVADAAPMRRHVRDAMGGTLFASTLISLFGAVALVLASVGLYAVLAYGVQQQRSEIGIRLALGATPAEVRRNVLVRGLSLAGSGIALGLGGSLIAGRAIRSLLIGVGPVDLPTLVAVSAFFFGVALLATWLPAHRATRVDPSRALSAQ